MARGDYKSDLSIDEKVMMAIVRVAELFKKELGAVFRKHGLTFSQYNVLRVLDASHDGQNTIINVRKIMLVSGARMTGLTKRLEMKGFIIRKNHSTDERIKVLEITPKGRQTLNLIFQEKEDNLNKYLHHYTDEEKSQVLSTIRQILKAPVM